MRRTDYRMRSVQEIPSFDIYFPDLDQFIHGLVRSYNEGSIRSWDNLEEKVGDFFRIERMNQIESAVPHWHKMASYDNGVTLVHVMCVFLGLYMMPEYLSMTKIQQQVMKWTILLHDVEKEPQEGKRDHAHAFRSAVTAARTLPKLGFHITTEYDSLIQEWSELTCTAITKPENSPDIIQDNRKLPEILSGVERMFGHRTPAALIIKTILFHLSVNMKLWPPAAPLTNEEVRRYLDRELVPMLRVMNLGDSEGWSMFDSSREALRNDTLEAFKGIERIILAE
jgi:hypothetical protein